MMSRAALGPTQPPVQWVRGDFSLRVKQLGREADYSPPSSAEVKNGGAIPPFSHMSSWHSTELIKHRDNFALSENAGSSSSGMKCKNVALLVTCFTVVSCLAYSSTLKTEARCSSETSYDFQRTARHCIPDYGTQLSEQIDLAVFDSESVVVA
jgi:hypothetical protein